MSSSSIDDTIILKLDGLTVKLGRYGIPLRNLDFKMGVIAEAVLVVIWRATVSDDDAKPISTFRQGG